MSRSGLWRMRAPRHASFLHARGETTANQADRTGSGSVCPHRRTVLGARRGRLNAERRTRKADRDVDGPAGERTLSSLGVIARVEARSIASTQARTTKEPPSS